MGQDKTWEEIRKGLSKEEIQANDLAHMKRASSWLIALSLESDNYILNKRDFFDAVQLRYRWNLKPLPNNCVCKERFNIANCQFNCQVVRQCSLWCEPPLEQLSGKYLPNTASRDKEARLDIAVGGFREDGAMSFFDVRVLTHLPKLIWKNNL